MDFEAVLARVALEGWRGVNVTHPYKERVVTKIAAMDRVTRLIGAVNTVVFSPSGLQGHNTDYSGFINTYRTARGTSSPGRVCLIGAGGVGRAISFALATLNASEIRIFDRDPTKAMALEASICSTFPGVTAMTCLSTETAARGADGIVNCSWVGMNGHEGTPIHRRDLKGAIWAFDSVYTPSDTLFLREAASMGLNTISGYELFFRQGLDAWTIFSGRHADEVRLRGEISHSVRTP
jgi:shikimate dehydrogenase